MNSMNRELIEAKKIEMKEFMVATLELEQFPEEWNRSLGFVYRFLKDAVKLEEDKEIIDKTQRNRILIKLVEDSIFGCSNDFLLEDYKYYLNTGDDDYIFITAIEKVRDSIIRLQDKSILEMIESGQI